MSRKHWGLAGAMLGTALLVSWTGFADEPKVESKGSGTFDSTVQSIKKGAQDAGDAIKGQYSRAKIAVHNMGVSSRVYGRLHWDKALYDAKVDIDVKDDGVTTLTGVVADAAARAKAVLLARDTYGVTQVVDQLTIQSPPTTVPATVTPE